MSASATDYFQKASNGTRPSPTTLTGTKAIGASSISCGALTGWATSTGVSFCIYTTDTSGLKVAGSQTDWVGVVSGSTITNLTLKAGSDNGYSIGAIVEAAPIAAWADNMVTGITAHANQDGSLIASAVQTALGQGAATGAGWTTLGVTLNTVTALGNRSYSGVINGSDQTGILSPGMRLRTTRTVAAPTQCTSLNGTTQYYSKTSPAGMTFTDDFVVSAWVKLSSYAVAPIASRYNGTSGWLCYIDTTGQVILNGYNAGSGNLSQIKSYQSVPLNKWVHVTAQLDMSSFTATTTTSYVMIDGVAVPSFVARSGTNPTTLVQAGNLEIGSYNGGTSPFPGKIAQVAIYSAKVTQATILASMHQTLTGSETSLISAYSFNNSITDLNANANNLTANGSAVATATDSPYGGQADGTISSTIDYGIITKTAFSTNTTLTVQVPEGCAIPTSGGVSAVSYSTQKVPYGWPAQTGKWRVETLAGTSITVGIAGINVWYSSVGLFALNVPIGSWQRGYQGNFRLNSTVSGVRSGHFTVADTAPTNAVRTQDMTYWMYGDVNTTDLVRQINKSTAYTIAAATVNSVYGDITSASGTEVYKLDGDQGQCSLYVDNAYA